MSTRVNNNLQRILIAMDDSHPAEWAMRTGVQLALELCARVRIVHVAEPAVVTARQALLANEIDMIHLRQGRELLKRIRISLPRELEADTCLRFGFAADQIVSVAGLWNADMIVVGSRGHKRFANLVLGSTAAAVIRHADCPVVTVSHEPTYPPAKTSEWVGVGADCADPLASHAQNLQ